MRFQSDHRYIEVPIETLSYAGLYQATCSCGWASIRATTSRGDAKRFWERLHFQPQVVDSHA